MAPRLCIALAVVALGGCNAPAPPDSTGGTDVAAGPCGRGLVVVNTEYASTNVSLLGFDGTVLSSSFVSSATSDAKLSVPLGADVAVPTAAASGDEIVLLDRYPASVITWVRVKDAHVTRQLSVATGFGANVKDYVPLGEHKAYVTRYEPNGDPGQEPFDAGDDVLVIDPSVPEITGRIDLSSAMEDPTFFARPSRAVRVGEKVFVLLESYSLYWDSAPSRIAILDSASDGLESVVMLGGLEGCTGLSLSPDAAHLAITCSGDFAHGSNPDPKTSGIALVDVATGTLSQTLPAAELGDAPLGMSLSWASEDVLLTTTLGTWSGRPDRLLSFAPAQGTVQELLRSREEPFTLGDVLCQPECGLCFVADADRGVVQRFQRLPSGELDVPQAVAVDTRVGLPPRYLGSF